MSAPDGAFLSSAEGKPPVFAEKVRCAAGRAQQWQRIEKSGAAGKPCDLHVGEVGNCLWRLHNQIKSLDRLRKNYAAMQAGKKVSLKALLR